MAKVCGRESRLFIVPMICFYRRRRRRFIRPTLIGQVNVVVAVAVLLKTSSS